MSMDVDFFHAEFRTKRIGFPDLLRYSSIVRDGIVLGKGGELISTFSYRGPDMQCSSQGELNYLRLRVCNMIKGLSGGWMIHSTTLRKESIKYEHDGLFPDAVTRAIENERINQYQQEGTHYENEYFITFTYLPDAILTSRVKDFAFDRENKTESSAISIAAKAIDYFERKVADYVGLLESAMSKRMVKLSSRQVIDPKSYRSVWYDDQLAYLHECLTLNNYPVRLPCKTIPTGIDFLIGSLSFLPGIRPRLDNKFIRVVAIESPPDEGTTFGMLEVLNTLGVSFRWTTRWIARDAEKAKASTRKIRSKWRQKIRGFVADMTGRQGGAINHDAEAMAIDAEAVITDWESGDVAYGYWTSTVVLMDAKATTLEAAVRFLIKHISSQGFCCRDEDVNCTEAFLGSLPGHGYENVRRPEIHSMNLADCLPLTATWQGPTRNPCGFYQKAYGDRVVPPLFQGSATGGTPFRVVLHTGDVGHTFIGGPTGAGKSTLLGLIAAQHFRYPNAQFFGFEKGESMLALCLGAGGSHYNFLDDATSDSSSIGFAPFCHIDRLTDKIWAIEYLEIILTLNGLKVDFDISSEITRAIELLSTRPITMRSFTDLNQLVQVRAIKQVLNLYEKNFAGGMLNFSADNISTSRFTVFEMEKLMDMNDKHVVPVLLYLFRMIERTLTGAPTIICIDEAWLMLQHPMFEEKLREWFKVLRKANALVIFATQELQDVANSPIASTIFSSCQTKILLPNPAAQMEDNAKLYKAIGMSAREIELASLATPKRDYFFTSPAGRRLFQLELGPVALAFMAASGTEDRATVKSLYQQHGAKWVPFWLELKGISPSVLMDYAK
jgi:type IV secretion/conjugal transfer VirB4 family ATPase